MDDTDRADAVNRRVLATVRGVADDWLSVEAAADASGVTYRTMLAKVRRGELPAEKPEGKPYRLRRQDVDVEQSRSSPGSSPPRRPVAGGGGRRPHEAT